MQVPSAAGPEELAGPPQPEIRPISAAARIDSIDVLRGMALPGTLLMNIDVFAGPETTISVPQGLPDTTFSM